MIFNSAPLWGLIQGLFVGFGAVLWKWIRGRGPILTMNHQVYPTQKNYITSIAVFKHQRLKHFICPFWRLKTRVKKVYKRRKHFHTIPLSNLLSKERSKHSFLKAIHFWGVFCFQTGSTGPASYARGVMATWMASILGRSRQKCSAALVPGFKDLLIFTLVPKKMIQFDEDFSSGWKPPTMVIVLSVPSLKY